MDRTDLVLEFQILHFRNLRLVMIRLAEIPLFRSRMTNFVETECDVDQQQQSRHRPQIGDRRRTQTHHQLTTFALGVHLRTELIHQRACALCLLRAVIIDIEVVRRRDRRLCRSLIRFTRRIIIVRRTRIVTVRVIVIIIIVVIIVVGVIIIVVGVIIIGVRIGVGVGVIIIVIVIVTVRVGVVIIVIIGVSIVDDDGVSALILSIQLNVRNLRRLGAVLLIIVIIIVIVVIIIVVRIIIIIIIIIIVI